MKKMNRRLGVMETEWTAPENIEEELLIDQRDIEELDNSLTFLISD